MFLNIFCFLIAMDMNPEPIKNGFKILARARAIVSGKQIFNEDTAYATLVFKPTCMSICNTVSMPVEHAALVFEFRKENGEIDYHFTHLTTHELVWLVGDDAIQTILENFLYGLKSNSKPEYKAYKTLRISKQRMFDVYESGFLNENSNLIRSFEGGVNWSWKKFWMNVTCAGYVAEILKRIRPGENNNADYANITPGSLQALYQNVGDPTNTEFLNQIRITRQGLLLRLRSLDI